MARELGTKFVCFKCSTKFYDMKKPAPVCPKCGADQRDVPVVTKGERKRAAPAPKPAEPVEEELVDETTEEAEEEDDDEDEAP